MEFVELFGKHKTARFAIAIAGFLLIVTSGIVAYSAPFGSVLASPSFDGPRVGVRILYFAACSIAILCSVLWFSASSWFAKNLKTPFNLWTAHDEPETDKARSAREEYALRCRKYALLIWLNPRNCSYIKRPEALETRQIVKYSIPKFLFAAIWATFFILATSSTMQMDTSPLAQGLLTALICVTTFVNGFSYWLCCMYVLHLKDVYQMRLLCYLPHELSVPASTPQFMELNAIARGNYTLFLSVVLMIAMATMSIIQLFPSATFAPGGNPAFVLLCASSFTLVGLVTFLVLFVLSKFFLSGVLDRWRTDAIAKLPDHQTGKSRGGATPEQQLALISAKQDVIKGINERPRMTYLDAASVAIAIATFAVNLATLVGTVGL